MAASLLRPGLQYTPDVAEPLLREKTDRSVVAVKPHFQNELETVPWNMTDDKAASWIHELREQVCPSDPNALAVMRIQGHFQHGSNVNRRVSGVPETRRQKRSWRHPHHFRERFLRRGFNVTSPPAQVVLDRDQLGRRSSRATLSRRVRLRAAVVDELLFGLGRPVPRAQDVGHGGVDLRVLGCLGGEQHRGRIERK